MSDNGNTNIVHVNQIQGLLFQVAEHIKKLTPDQAIANVFSEQSIAKHNAMEGLTCFQECDINALQKVFE